jgi:hypothetical protein
MAAKNHLKLLVYIRVDLKVCIKNCEENIWGPKTYIFFSKKYIYEVYV